MSHTGFSVNLHSAVVLMSRNSVLERDAISDILSDCNGIRTHNLLVRKRTRNHLAKLVLNHLVKVFVCKLSGHMFEVIIF